MKVCATALVGRRGRGRGGGSRWGRSIVVVGVVHGDMIMMKGDDKNEKK